MGSSEVIEGKPGDIWGRPISDNISLLRLVKWTGGDLDIVRSARVSYNAEWRAGKDEGSDSRLIRYLMRNNHTSPFEHVVLTFEVVAPIFVLRQWHRHRTQSYSEVSARYSELDLGYYVPSIEQIGVQSKDNKQGRDTEARGDMNPTAAQSIIRDHMNVSHRTYKQLLEMGVAREIARIVLPVAAYSHMFTTMNLHNFFRFVGLRSHGHAQYEIRVFSNMMIDMVREHVAPVAMQAMIDKEWPEDNPNFRGTGQI